MSLNWDKREAEAEGNVEARRGVAVAERRTAAAGVVVPAAAPNHAARATARPLRVGRIAVVTTIVFIIPVTAPFPDIAVHIIEAPGVWSFLSNGMSRTTAVLFIPPDFIQIVNRQI